MALTIIRELNSGTELEEMQSAQRKEKLSHDHRNSGDTLPVAYMQEYIYNTCVGASMVVSEVSAVGGWRPRLKYNLGAKEAAILDKDATVNQSDISIRNVNSAKICSGFHPSSALN
ncbi:hypothetical protein LguiA_015073 [Lonicera macranthoides]